jgi:hypothetical protein
MRCRLTFCIRFQVSPDRLPIRSTLALNQEQILRCPPCSGIEEYNGLQPPLFFRPALA